MTYSRARLYSRPRTYRISISGVTTISTLETDEFALGADQSQLDGGCERYIE